MRTLTSYIEIHLTTVPPLMAPCRLPCQLKQYKEVRYCLLAFNLLFMSGILYTPKKFVQVWPDKQKLRNDLTFRCSLRSWIELLCKCELCINPAGLFQTNHSKVKDNLCSCRPFRSSDLRFHSRDSRPLPPEFPPHRLLSENQHFVPCDGVPWTNTFTLS